jgi:hypothetical protein
MRLPDDRYGCNRWQAVHQYCAVRSSDPRGLERADIAGLYERYLACCNERRFDQLGEFVNEQVGGPDPRMG